MTVVPKSVANNGITSTAASNTLGATSFNYQAFKKIKKEAKKASETLAENRGEAPDISGSGLRNAHALAIAPNASSSIICSGTSPSIEPYRANVYTHKTLSGSYQVKNKYLEKLLEKKEINNDKTWTSILANRGSVLHIKELSDYEKDTFKTAPRCWVQPRSGDKRL